MGSGRAPATGGATGTGGTSTTGGAPGTGGTTSTGGVIGTGGVSGRGGVSGTGGVTGTGGVPGTGGNQDAGSDGPANEPCTPNATYTSSTISPTSIGTIGPYCIRVQADLVGWNCNNFLGRTVRVNGVTMICGTLPQPAKINDSYYFDISAGTYDYASIYWY